MKLLTSILPLALLGLVSAGVTEGRGLDIARRSPEEEPTHASLEERSTQTCDQWGSVQTGTYTVYNNLWGQSSATSGSQCTTVTGLTNGILSWKTAWTWAGGPSSVKSYSNAALDFTATKLSAISSLRAVWSWKYAYTGTSIVANVAFDSFLSSSCSSTTNSDYEIMIWLAALGGAGPLSSTGKPIATVTLANYSFSLYYGLNGSTKVYSFVAASQINKFDGDAMVFFNYLVSNQGVPSSSCLTKFQAGTEPFTGTSAVLSSSYYAVLK